MKLLITIDTEEDDAWSGRPEVTTENVTYLRRFQDLCDRHQMKPTWLCSFRMRHYGSRKVCEYPPQWRLAARFGLGELRICVRYFEW